MPEGAGGSVRGPGGPISQKTLKNRPTRPPPRCQWNAGRSPTPEHPVFSLTPAHLRVREASGWGVPPHYSPQAPNLKGDDGQKKLVGWKGWRKVHGFMEFGIQSINCTGLKEQKIWNTRLCTFPNELSDLHHSLAPIRVPWVLH